MDFHIKVDYIKYGEIFKLPQKRQFDTDFYKLGLVRTQKRDPVLQLTYLLPGQIANGSSHVYIARTRQYEVWLSRLGLVIEVCVAVK